LRAPSNYTIPAPYNERTFSTGVDAGSISAVFAGGLERTGTYTVSANGEIVFYPGSAPSAGSAVSYRQSADITDAAITAAADAVNAAISVLRAESITLSTDLATVATRVAFDTDMVSVFTHGADKLILADMNEEGANMLMLQTRQALGVTALSISA
jgi:flagellin-like hook-associated protein FlgL